MDRWTVREREELQDGDDGDPAAGDGEPDHGDGQGVALPQLGPDGGAVRDPDPRPLLHHRGRRQQVRHELPAPGKWGIVGNSNIVLKFCGQHRHRQSFIHRLGLFILENTGIVGQCCF